MVGVGATRADGVLPDPLAVIVAARQDVILSRLCQGETRMAKPIKFAHVVFQTRRFEEMIAWYEGVFEARVVYRNSSLAFLTYDDEHHRFAFTRLPDSEPNDGGVRARGDAGVHHLAYTYANLGDLLETYARLKQSGVTPYWPIHHGMTRSLYYQDPDGNRLEFQVDACSVETESGSME
jgi:catechol-2,3-dioxygenase